MIRGSEGAGLTVSLLGHVVLFGILSVGFLATPNPLKLKPQPVEVALVDDVGLESTSPNPTSEAPAARLSPVEAPIEPETAPPEPASNPEPSRPQPSAQAGARSRRAPGAQDPAQVRRRREPLAFRAESAGRTDRQARWHSQRAFR